MKVTLNALVAFYFINMDEKLRYKYVKLTFLEEWFCNGGVGMYFSKIKYRKMSFQTLYKSILRYLFYGRPLALVAVHTTIL